MSESDSKSESKTNIPESFDLIPLSNVKFKTRIGVDFIQDDDKKEHLHRIHLNCGRDIIADLVTVEKNITHMSFYEEDTQCIEHPNMGKVLLTILCNMNITEEVASKYKDDKEVVFVGCTFEQCVGVWKWVIGLDYRMFISCNGLYLYGDEILEHSDIVGSVKGLENGHPSTISDVNFYMCDMTGVLSNQVRYGNIGFAMCSFDDFIRDEDLWYYIGMFERNDISRIDFRGMDFSGRYMRNTNFTESNLKGACFEEADLRLSCFTGADITDAKFNGAVLTGAKFNDIILDKGVELGGLLGL